MFVNCSDSTEKTKKTRISAENIQAQVAKKSLGVGVNFLARKMTNWPPIINIIEREKIEFIQSLTTPEAGSWTNHMLTMRIQDIQRGDTAGILGEMKEDLENIFGEHFGNNMKGVSKKTMRKLIAQHQKKKRATELKQYLKQINEDTWWVKKWLQYEYVHKIVQNLQGTTLKKRLILNLWCGTLKMRCNKTKTKSETEGDNCPLCGFGREDEVHILKECIILTKHKKALKLPDDNTKIMNPQVAYKNDNNIIKKTQRLLAIWRNLRLECKLIPKKNRDCIGWI